MSVVSESLIPATHTKAAAPTKINTKMDRGNEPNTFNSFRYERKRLAASAE